MEISISARQSSDMNVFTVHACAPCLEIVADAAKVTQPRESLHQLGVLCMHEAAAISGCTHIFAHASDCVNELSGFLLVKLFSNRK